MIQTLQRFEDTFPDVDNTRQGGIFKTDLRNMFNDAIRAQRDELNDYEVEYRPLRITDSGTLAMTQSFMQTVQKIEFTDRPSIRIYASSDKAKILDALRIELGAGLLYTLEEFIILEVCSVQECVSSVIPMMDKYSLHQTIRKQYLDWRSNLVKMYTQA